jgi:hypothetical protein
MLEDLCEHALSIRLNPSEDGDWSDLQSPEKEKDLFRIKCFQCHGTNNATCRECNGTQMITNAHPLALLLNQVLNSKLNLKKKE